MVFISYFSWIFSLKIQLLFDYVVTICKYDENEKINQLIIRFKNKGHKSKTLKKDNKYNPKIKYVKY